METNEKILTYRLLSGKRSNRSNLNQFNRSQNNPLLSPRQFKLSNNPSTHRDIQNDKIDTNLTPHISE